MRKVSNYANKKLQDEQFRVLINLISNIDEKKELVTFLNALLTKSEKVYLSQRLNIMRMLAKSFSYDDIQKFLGVPKGTISKTNLILYNGGLNLKQVLLKHKFKFSKIEKNSIKSTVEQKDFNKPHYPGAIKP